jgi:hypothetical protein
MLAGNAVAESRGGSGALKNAASLSRPAHSLEHRASNPRHGGRDPVSLGRRSGGLGKETHMGDIITNLAPPSRVARLKRDQRLRRFRRQLLAVAPNLDDPRFRPLLDSFGRISLLALDGYEFLRAHGLTNAEGELRASVDTFQRLAGQQLKLARELGLTPAALGKLKNERPIDLAAAIVDAEVVDEPE